MLYDDGSKVLGENDYIVENDVYFHNGIAPEDSPFYNESLYGAFTDMKMLYDGAYTFSMVDVMKHKKGDIHYPTFFGKITPE